MNSIIDVPPSTTFNSSSDATNHQFETCLISNADLAALASANGVGDPSGGHPGGVKIESNHDRINNYNSASDAVHYFDPEATLASVDSEEQQRLIKVYQTAMESGDNKMITVYEIKPDDEGGGFHPLDGGNNSVSHSDGRGGEYQVEIVHSAEDEQLLRSVTEDGTLVLPPSISGSGHSLTGSTLVNLPQSFVTAPTTVAELRCTLCGFVSFARDEIAEHCQTAHDLFLCQTCNLVFKRKQSLQAHAKSKHGQILNTLSSASIVTNASSLIGHGGRGSSGGIGIHGAHGHGGHATTKNRAAGRINKRQRGGIINQLQPRRSLGSLSAGSTSSPLTSIEMMSDIKDILSKNKAVLPVLAHSGASTSSSPSGGHTSGSVGSRRGGGSTGSGGSKRGGRRSSAHDWARVGSLTAQQQQQLMLDSRLNDPQTRHQFNTEFAKKITSHGIGAEVLGLSEERLPSKKGTYRLEIKERVLENGEPMPVGTAKRDSASGALPENLDLYYSYDIMDTKQSAPDGGCLVVCGLCNFSNARIENVLFHCEIDHKQYYCHNKRCHQGK